MKNIQFFIDHSDMKLNKKILLDSTTFKNIYEAHYKRVYNYVSYRIKNHFDTEDLVSSVFERVLLKYHTYHPRKNTLDAWIIGITKNVIADYFRMMKKNAFGCIDTMPELVSDGDQPELIVINNESNLTLIKALDVLKDKERDIISMKFAADLKNHEIAKIMGLSQSNIVTIINRTLSKLHKEIERLMKL
jgi:RNA polymerase sigma-70 factor (ECF subfamily)